MGAPATTGSHGLPMELSAHSLTACIPAGGRRRALRGFGHGVRRDCSAPLQSLAQIPYDTPNGVPVDAYVFDTYTGQLQLRL